MLKAGYLCKKCGFKNMEVEVRERADKEDIQNYVHHVGNKCGENHSLLCPLCSSREIDLMVPITQNGIGVAGPELTEQDQEDLKDQLKGEKK